MLSQMLAAWWQVTIQTTVLYHNQIGQIDLSEFSGRDMYRSIADISRLNKNPGLAAVSLKSINSSKFTNSKTLNLVNQHFLQASVSPNCS